MVWRIARPRPTGFAVRPLRGCGESWPCVESEGPAGRSRIVSAWRSRPSTPYTHVAIDDASRLAYVEVLPDQRGDTARAFFERAHRWFAKRQIDIERVLTDNGSCYISRSFRQALKRHDIRHLRTQAYRPQTNGKAERFIGTMLGGWAYARAYGTSNQRTRALPKWLRYYNEERPHRALGMTTPLQRSLRAS